MNSVICSGCKKFYTKGLSFQVHKWNCQKLVIATQEFYKKCEAYNQSTSGLKTAQYEDSSVNNLVFQHQDL